MQAGLTPSEALVAATGDAARVLLADSIGVIAPGRLADFVVLDADPLADIRNTRQISSVIIGGSVFLPTLLRRAW